MSAPDGVTTLVTEEVPTAERVLTAAAGLFRAKGYGATTTRELAALLDIRNASLYYHFPRKQDILYGVCLGALTRIREQVEDAVTQAGSDPIDRLVAFVDAHVRAALAEQNNHAVMLIELRSLGDEQLVTLVGMRDDYQLFLRSLIDDGVAAGVIRPDVSSEHLVLAVLNLLNWTIFWFKPDGKLDPQQWAATLTTILFDGVLQRPPDGSLPTAQPDPR